VMPALSGAARMRYLTFLLFNALGGLVWGCGVVMVGYLAGASYAKVEHTVGRGAAIAVGAIVVVGLVVWRVRAHRAERRKEHSEGSPEGEPRERQRATKASSLGKGRS